MTFYGMDDEEKKKTYLAHSTGFTVVLNERSDVVHYRDEGLPLCNATFALSHDEHQSRIDWFNHEKQYRPCERCLLALWAKDNNPDPEWLDDDNDDHWLHLPFTQQPERRDPHRWMHQ